MEPKKSPFKSKTLYASLLVAVLAFFPSVQVIAAANPEMVGMVLAGIFGVLRIVTKGKIAVE